MEQDQKIRKRKPVRQKHVPQRSCIVCRQITAKRELVRVVRGLDGRVEIDLTGKKPGRGAYICRNKPCWDLALKRRSIEHALQSTISPEDREKLVGFMATLSGSSEEREII